MALPLHPAARAIPSVVKVIEEISDAEDRPWLILGKGPTAQHRRLWDLHRFHVLTLNHAALVWPHAALRHFVDWEAFQDCQASFPDGTRVVLPWLPHLNHVSTRRRLAEFALKAHRDLRYCSYHSQRALVEDRPDLPRLLLKKFSATAAFDMLLRSGIREIFSLGVDGGTQYAPDFDPKDRLANGQKSFDVQMPLIAQMLQKRRATWHRLHINTDAHPYLALPATPPAA